MRDFFISYNSADRSWAEWVAWQLEAAGCSTIIQAWDFRPGSNFVLEMDRAAREAERTIAILSPSYLGALYTHPEWAAAFAQDPTGTEGKLVAVRVMECDVKGLLRQIIYIDLLGLDKSVARDRLLAGVQTGRAKPTIEPDFPGARRPPPSPSPPYPGLLPSVWNVTRYHHRNPNFTGRQEIIGRLRSRLASGGTAALTQAIHGLGGVGKTQLAVEYAYRFASDYSRVWWLRAEEPVTLTSDYAGLATELPIRVRDASDQKEIIEAAHRWLEGNGGWLLIFDNASNQQSVLEYLPGGGGGHVIITSRNPSWGAIAAPLTVEVLTPEEAKEFLLKRTRQEDENAAAELAEELGYLPLALEQAAAYMEATGNSLSSYLGLFRDHNVELLRQDVDVAEYPATVATTWEMSFSQVAQGSPAAASLLNLCSFLGPDDIPRDILGQGAGRLPPPLSQAVASPLDFDEALGELRRFSLLEVTEGALSVHRLVAAVARDRLGEEERKAWAGAALRLVNDAFPFDSDDVRLWPQCARLLAHGLAAAGHAESLEVAPEETGRLLSQMGLYLNSRAEYAQARELYERTLRIGEAAYGPNHPTVAIRVNNLGTVLYDLGDLEGAREHYERALRISEAALGPGHPTIAIRVNNLGDVLRALGDLEGARELLQRALRIDEAAYGPDHPNVATGVNNLGRVLLDLGDLEGARELIQRALRISEAAYGPDHPNVATGVNNLGGVLRALGDLEGARAHFQRALRIDEAAFGPDHPNVAIRVNNLGMVLRALGDLEGAREHYERALRIFSASLGEDHPSTVTVRNNLQSLNP